MLRISKAVFSVFQAHRKQHPVAMGVFMVCVFLLIAADSWLDFAAAPPARNWLAENLQKIKTINPNSYAFAVFGDNKNSYTTFPELLKEVSHDQEIRFAMDLGDLVDSGEMEQYRYYFAQVRKNLNIPLLTAIGNHDLHEKGRGVYKDLFGSLYYSFQIGRDYFIVVDDANEKGLNQRQLRWLEAELIKAGNSTQRFVFMHVPLFDPRGASHHHCLETGPAHTFLDLFKKYKVNHIFAGHIHSYFTGKWEGIPFTITGGAGGPLYGEDPNHSFFHYLKVVVNDGNMNVSQVPIASPDRNWLDRIGPMTWLYLHAMVRFHGVEIAIFLLAAYALAVALEVKASKKPTK